MPGQLGDAVEATALLEAMRQAHPTAHLTALVKRRLRPILWGLDSVDQVLSVRRRNRQRVKPRRNNHERVSLVRLGRRLSRGGFDTAIILPGSFKSAALAAVAGIPRRIGYEREGRGVILTERLVQRRHRGELIHVPVRDQYMGIARYLGAVPPSPSPKQRISPAARRRLDSTLTCHELYSDTPLALIDQSYFQQGQSQKIEAIAAATSQLQTQVGLKPLLVPNQLLSKASKLTLADHGTAIKVLPELGLDLHVYKALVERCAMVIADDVALLSLASAIGTPVITPSKRAGGHEFDEPVLIEEVNRVYASRAAVTVGGGV